MDTQVPLLEIAGLSEYEHVKKGNNNSDDRQCLNKTDPEEHGTLQLALQFWLAGNPFNCAANDQTVTNTGSD